MTTVKRKRINFCDLSEYEKDNILTYIKSKEVSIKKAAADLNVSVTIINKIFTERYTKRIKKTTLDLNPRKNYHKEYWIENKLK